MYHVEPFGEPIRFRVADITVTKASVSEMDNNTYLLVPDSGPALLIDAADSPELIKKLVGDSELGYILTTHRHQDHVQALRAIASSCEAQVLAGEDDAHAIADETGVISEPVWDKDHFVVGESLLQVIGLVGHTPGSIAVALEPEDGPAHIFTGDSLFPGGVGKTDGKENFESLLNDVTTKIFDVFGDDTVIHPGHGDATTLGAERGQLEQWRQRGW